MSSITQQTILITGATDGIGLALARIYQERGARLILVGRRSLDRLDGALFSARSYCQADLSHDDSAEKIARFLYRQGIEQLDLLIHNAALAFYGASETQSLQSVRELVAVNLLAPIALTHALLPLLERANGKIVFISSVVSALASPQYAVYSATKAALDGLARNLRIELQNSVAVQTIHPGATRTAMHAKSGMSKDVTNWERFPPVEGVAAKIARAIDGRQSSATIGLGNRLLRFGGTHLAPLFDGAMRINARRAPTPNPSPNTRGGEGEQKTAPTPDPSPNTRGGENTAPTPDPSPNTRGGAGGGGRCVITGAADGIGRVLAYRFAAAGYAIIGIDVDAERATQTQTALQQEGASAEFIIADLASEAGINHLLESLRDRPPIDVFIHNAGISAVGAFGQIELAKQRAVIQLNLLAPMLITAGLLQQKKMSTGDSGSALVFISSLSHFASYPGATTYAASKDGLASYARSLSVAYTAQNMHVLTVYPGPTRTAHARRYSPDNSREARRMPPEQLADAIYRALKARKRILIPGVGNRLFATLGRTFPRLTERIMRKTIFEKLARQTPGD